MAEEGHASGSLLNSSNLQFTGKKKPVDVTDPLSTNGILQGVGHKAVAYQWLRKFISKEKDAVCDGDTGLYNVELWSVEVSCLEIPLCLASLLS